MWVIPKNLSTSPSVQGTEALILDSRELLDLSEQSLLWRSSPSQSATWSQRWKKGLLRQHLYGRILKPSIGSSFVEEWISSQEASLASPFLPQDEDKQTPTPDTSSHTSSEESKYASLPLFSLKMSKESSPQNSAQKDGQTQKAHRFCSMYLESWRGWVMRRRQEYSQREKSVLHIGGNESSYLVLKEVPKEKAWSGSMNSLTETETQVALYTPPQEEESNTYGNPQESLWRSPATTEVGMEEVYTKTGEVWKGEGRAYRKNGVHKQVTLGVQIQATMRKGSENPELLWGTPNTLDHLGQRSDEALRRLARVGGRKRRSHPGNLREQVNPHAIEIYQDLLKETQEKEASVPVYKRETATTKSPQEQTQEKYKLNPRWVETLMGLPIGWVMPSCTSPLTIERMSSECLEMELSQILQEEPSSSYGENWSTPPASQRGENLHHYVSRMRSRLEQGKETFAPTLQVQAEAEERGVDIEESIWATPNTMDSLSLRSEEALRRQATTTRKGRTAPANLREQVDPKSCEIYASENKKSKGQVSLF